jgi:hypothetical protein
MSSQSRIEVSRTKTVAYLVLVTLGAALGGCSDIYTDRRETVALGADDHIAANRVAQMVDPWPRYVGDKNIAFNGERMQAAAERYRNGKVIPPVNVTTTSISQQQAQQAAASATTATSQSTTQSAPAAPVKY